jgi:glyoxylase-like metal-dependent hydrolase (beta-lactamase superfamily II)
MKAHTTQKSGELIIHKLTVGPLMSNCFIVGCQKTKIAAVIDPGDETERILLALSRSSLTLKNIINTHGHFDHVSGNKKLKDATGAEILIHPLDAPMLRHISASAAYFGLSSDDSPAPDRTVNEGDTIAFGEVILEVIHTPGHTPGGISLSTDSVVFVGDTLFAGSIGRTDLPGGDYDTLISSIRKKLFQLPDTVRVLCGHGPETTIGIEKRTNPFAAIR